MADSDYIIEIDEVNDIKAFFKSLLSFYASFDVTLTIWGRLPQEVHRSLSLYKARTSLIRRLFVKQTDLCLNEESLKSIDESLCNDSLLEKFKWGIIKGDIPLGHGHAWDDMLVCGSDLIDDTALLQWVEELKSNEIIAAYEKIMD